MNQHFSVLFTMGSRNKWTKFLSLFLAVFFIVTLMMPHVQGNGLQAVHGCTPGSSSNCLPHSAHPTLFDCPSQGFFADPFNCSFYYHCHGDLHYGCVCPCPVVNSNGILTQRHFNNVSNVCVTPSQSNCVPQTTTSLTTSATTSATTSTSTTSPTTSPTTSLTTTTTTTTTQSSADGSGSSNSDGAALVIAIIVGLGLIAVSICLLALFLKWRKERKELERLTLRLNDLDGERQGGHDQGGNSPLPAKPAGGVTPAPPHAENSPKVRESNTHLPPGAKHGFTGTPQDGTTFRKIQPSDSARKEPFERHGQAKKPPTAGAGFKSKLDQPQPGHSLPNPGGDTLGGSTTGPSGGRYDHHGGHGQASDA